MSSRIPLIAALVACAAVFFLMVRIGKLEGELSVMKAHPGTIAGNGSSPAAAAEQPEVAVFMGRIQEFANKLWFAGRAGNAPLADFYRHEMKEAMEELAHAGIVDDGVNVSEKMELYGIRTLDAIKEEMKAHGLEGFDAQYAGLIGTCNTCHAECGKPFIRVQQPVAMRYDDQDFSPIH